MQTNLHLEAKIIYTHKEALNKLGILYNRVIEKLIFDMLLFHRNGRLK
ncbi:hypothetical protein LEP1GSC170_4909 [Leptospira interrogans serovar Bataviae str. HAI135]|nr:hypothetical protein LEP1GSC170_4909 [Leptospira interrogans serovar Bataviae str. HAI135]